MKSFAAEWIEHLSEITKHVLILAVALAIHNEWYITVSAFTQISKLLLFTLHDAIFHGTI